MGRTATEHPRRRRGTCVAAGGAAAACAVLLVAALAGAEDDAVVDHNRAVLAAEEIPTDGDAETEGHTAEVPVTVRPTRWMPSRGRRPCQRYRRRLVCDGPRRTPVPEGEAAELAERLGLGTRDAATHLLLHGPRDRWLDATPPVEGEDLLWPVEGGALWRGYGRVGGRGRGRRRVHEGLDIGAAEGTPIRAAQAGLVAYADNGVRGYGNLIMVVHADGSVAFYAHCEEAWVFAGQTVRRGQGVGTVGHTGLARGPHLHFELRVAGRPQNALRLMDEPPES